MATTNLDHHHHHHHHHRQQHHFHHHHQPSNVQQNHHYFNHNNNTNQITMLNHANDRTPTSTIGSDLTNAHKTVANVVMYQSIGQPVGSAVDHFNPIAHHHQHQHHQHHDDDDLNGSDFANKHHADDDVDDDNDNDDESAKKQFQVAQDEIKFEVENQHHQSSMIDTLFSARQQTASNTSQLTDNSFNRHHQQQVKANSKSVGWSNVGAQPSSPKSNLSLMAGAMQSKHDNHQAKVSTNNHQMILQYPIQSQLNAHYQHQHQHHHHPQNSSFIEQNTAELTPLVMISNPKHFISQYLAPLTLCFLPDFFSLSSSSSSSKTTRS